MSSNGYVNKPGQGAAFYNSRKKNEKQPDWTGEFEWNGEQLQIAFWERKSKAKGTQYLAFQVGPRFNPGQNKDVPQRPVPVAGSIKDDPDDSIPF